MATTVELNTRSDINKLPPVVITNAAGQLPVLASTKILKGTMAMAVSGKARKAATAVAGSVLLGVAMETYDNSGLGVDTLMNQVYERGAFYFSGLGGDLPTAANIGGLVAINDENTVKATVVANDLTVKLLGIEGTQFLVQIQ